VGEIVLVPLETYRIEYFYRFRGKGLGKGNSFQLEREKNVLQYVLPFQESVMLKHQGDPLRLDGEFSYPPLLQTRKDVHEGCFPAA